jgi:hypothetical protein
VNPSEYKLNVTRCRGEVIPATCHSWFFSLPLGRFHSSNSHAVRAISVTPRAENSHATWRINLSSAASNWRPPDYDSIFLIDGGPSRSS